MNTKEMIVELKDLINSIIKEEVSNYKEEYLNSEYYKSPKLKDCISENMADDIQNFLDQLENDKITDFEEILNQFQESAKFYGARWYDEDLRIYRSGYEYECLIYVKLINIIHTSLGREQVKLDMYYQG